MEDGFPPWLSPTDFNILKNILENLHPNIKFTVQPKISIVLVER